MRASCSQCKRKSLAGLHDPVGGVRVPRGVSAVVVVAVVAKLRFLVDEFWRKKTTWKRTRTIWVFQWI
jgi:hypothetical protein